MERASEKIVFYTAAAILVAIGFSLAMTAIAWSITLRDALFLPLWIVTVIGLILSLAKEKTGLYILIAVALLWLLRLAGDLGWFLTFEPGNSTLWLILAVPSVASSVIVSRGAKILFRNKRNIRLYLTGAAILIPIVGVLSYANKTYEKHAFAELHNLDSANYKLVFKPTPGDTRKFETTQDSRELRDLAKSKATPVAGHHYFPNALLRVRMTFSTIKGIELYKIEDIELAEPIKWRPAELIGETDFLKL